MIKVWVQRPMHSRPQFVVILALCIVGGPCTGWSQVLDRPDSLADGARSAAQYIEERLHSGMTVEVQPFKVMGGIHDGFRLALAQELAKIGFKVCQSDDDCLNALAWISGDITDLRSQEEGSVGKLIGAKVQVRLRSDVAPPEVRTIRIFNRDEAHRIGGKSGERLPPPSPEQDRGISEPSVVVSPRVTDLGSTGQVADDRRSTAGGESGADSRGKRHEARPRPGSPYGVCVLKEIAPGKFKNVAVKQYEGDFRVELSAGDHYLLNLINDSDYDAIGRVMIDGVPRNALASDPADATRDLPDLIRRHSERPIQGWYKSDRHDSEFIVGEYASSVAKRVLRTAEPTGDGIIIVEFAAAWQPQDPTPPNEPPRPQGLRTTEGRLIESATRQVSMRIGEVRAMIKIHY